MARRNAAGKYAGIIAREARLMKEGRLTLELLEVFAGEREGNEKERGQVRAITGALKQGIYREAVYLLTHTWVERPKEARVIFDDIIYHRNSMVRLLKRHVSMQVAALDYMQNVRTMLKRPTVIEADQYNEFAYRTILDETTHAYEKELLDADLDAEIEKARRFHSVFSVLFLDLDNLKYINDAHGHETGTKAIQALSACARENLRKYDSIYRYGGDEFVILLPRADARQAAHTARRIGERVRQVAESEMPEPLGVSIGIAVFDGKMIADRTKLLEKADAALYEAKRSEKGAVRIYHENAGESAGANVSEDVVAGSISGRAVLRGIGLVSGWCVGKAVHYRDILSREIEVREIKQHEIERELGRVVDAIEQVKGDLENIRGAFEHHGAAGHAAIFDVHKMILDDAELLGRIEAELKSRMVNSEHVVRSVFKNLERRFRSSGSAMLADRALDIRDIGSRLLRVLTGVEDSILAHISGDAVIFAKRLLPSDTVHFTHRKPRGIVTEEGGPSSHSALIARSLGIPSVSDIAADPAVIPGGAPVIVDGEKGEVVVEPRDVEIAAVRAKIRGQSRTRNVVRRKAKMRTLRTDSQTVKILANASSAEDVKTARELGCDGIGLYRTETLYMLAGELPGEDELFASLSRSLAGFDRGPVVLRLADIGGDKTLPYLSVGWEHASHLGVRGVRFLLRFPDLLRTQLRVFYRLAAVHDIRMLVPFVTGEQDMLHVREVAREVASSLGAGDAAAHGAVPLGAMIETPLAAMRIGSILPHADFVSIGTNDLIQYLAAADRESLDVADYYQQGVESALSLAGACIRRCRMYGRESFVCGDLAADMRYTKRFLRYKLSNFSVLPPLIPTLREQVYRIVAGSGHKDSRARKSGGR